MQYFIYDHPEYGWSVYRLKEGKKPRQVVKYTSEIDSISDTASTWSVTLRNCHTISGPRIDLRDVSNPVSPVPCFLLRK